MVVRQDVGYAWLILASTMIINYLCIGFCFGVIGVLTYEYESEFQEKPEQVSAVGSVLLSSLFISGPVAALLIGKLGVRLVVIVSVIIHLSAFLISAFATTWWHVVLSFAVPSGIACCCTHLCTMKILTVYFNKYQNMSYAASALGSDAAAISLPFVTTGIVKALRYRDSVFALSAILALNIPCAFLFKHHSSSFCGRKSADSALEEKFTTQNVKESDVELDDQLTNHEPTEIGLSQNSNNSSTVELEPVLSTDQPMLPADHPVLSTDQPVLSIDQPMLPADHFVQSTDQAMLPAASEVTDPNEDEHHTLRDHINLLCKPNIAVFILNNFLWNMGGAATSVLTYTFCIDRGFSAEAASLVLTLFGVGSFLGSLLVTISSFISNHYSLSLNRYYLHSTCNLVMGVCSAVIPFSTMNQVFITSLFFTIGAGYGAVCSNMCPTIEHINGSHMLYLVYSYELAAAGIGSLIGPIVGARLNGVRSSHTNTGYVFYFSAACELSALCLFVVYALVNRSITKPYSRVEGGSRQPDN